MSIVISGVNNNDKITASDGTIDLLSGVTYSGEITVPSLKLGSNIQLGNAGIVTATSFSGTTGTFGDFVDVGSNIQLGNAGVATATTFVGNLTGNVNNTGNLLFQIGGSEKVRIDSNGHISQGGQATPSSTNGNVGLKFGIKSALNNVIIGETTNGSMKGIILESRITGRSGGARCSQIMMGDGNIVFETAPSGQVISERLRIDSTGRLLLGSGATATPKITGPGGLDVSQYGLSICMGGSAGSSGQARANATTKEARLVIPHYTNAEEPLIAIAGFSASSFNYLNYGGGTSLGNVATRHQFYTAANTTTTGGSEKLKIEHSGVRSFATFVDTSYHANPDPLGDGSGIAYYRLNYNFQDSGRFGNHGQGIQGGDPTFALVNSSGEPCWNNPTDGAINLPNLKNSYPFSMAAWINVSSWPTSGDNDVIMNLSIGNTRVTLCICNWGGSYASDGADFYIMYGGQGHHWFRPSSKPTNTWIHVVYTVVGADNTSHRVYQNGSDLTTRGNRGGGHGGSAGWAMGGNADNSERFAIGKIGSIRFFNKALTASEANTLYTNDTFYT